MKRLAWILTAVATIGGLAWAGNLAPFFTEESKNGSEGWVLTSGKGKAEPPNGLQVTGTTQDTPLWTSTPVRVKSGKVYRLTAGVKSNGTGGCVICGLGSINRDFHPEGKINGIGYIFAVGNNQKTNQLRLGQWQRDGSTWFDNVELYEAIPFHTNSKEVELGDGESIRGGVYTFDPDFGYVGSNVSRPLVDFSCGFNSNRWTVGPSEWLIYRHHIGKIGQIEPTVRINVGYYSSGQCVVECGGDGKDWKELGRIGKVDTKSFSLPKELSNRNDVWIRIRGSAATDPQGAGSFQVYGYTYSARLNPSIPDMVGQTQFAWISHSTTGSVQAEWLSGGNVMSDEQQVLRFRVINSSLEEQPIQATVIFPGKSDSPSDPIFDSGEIALAPHSEKTIELPCDASKIGQGRAGFVITWIKKDTIPWGERTILAAKMDISIPPLYEASYGYEGGKNGVLNWWWCEGTYKVSRQRPEPTGSAKQAMISACRGEYEPVQIVLRPKESLKQMMVSVEGNDSIPASVIEVHRVAYHYVQRTSDSTGCIGWWPDALPEWKEPVDLAAGENQPIWVLVKIPQECKERSSQIHLKLRAENLPEVTIPINIRIYDFEMPPKSHVESGFGISLGNIRRYHNLQTQDEERQVWDLYMQSFREHRIAPYHFTPFDPIGVKWVGLSWEGGRVVDSGAASGAKCLMVEDDNPKAAINSGFTRFIPVEKGKSVRLQFKSRTQKAGQPYLVTLNTFDKSQQWISGHNIDLPQTGNGQWQPLDLRIVPSERSPDAAFVRLTLWAAPYSDAGEATGTVWFDDLSLKPEGSNTEWITNGGFEQADSLTAELDFTAWDKQAYTYLNRFDGFNSFMLPLQGTGGGTFESRSDGKIGPFEQGSDGYRKAFASYCGAIQQHLQDKGWLGKEYIYWFDEPEPKDYDFVRAGMDEIRRAGPKLRRMLTEEPIEPLYGFVDLWCPILDQFNPEICQSRQKQGEAIWWYVCTGPRAPYPGLFIDHSAIDLRMWLWMTWKWKVQGILVWESTYWTSDKAFPAPKMQNPWTDPMGYIGGYSFEPGFVGYWGNGDGRFLYPPNQDVANDKSKHLSGPVSSIRWEMLREGLEDYEYFWLLREAITKAEKAGKSAELLSKAQKLLDIGPEIVTDKTNFARDPQPLYERRAQVAEMIETLTGKP